MLDLARAMRDRRPGDVVVVAGAKPDLLPDLERWAALLGHAVVGTDPASDGLRFRVRIGSAPDRWLGEQGAAGEAPRHSVHETRDSVLDRLWMYTNFDCNLACSYCCVRSSPKAPRRRLPRDTITALASEARELGVGEIFLTGGEPFILDDLDLIAEACARALPTTILTNAMLFRGKRLEMLERMPRDRLTLQVSLDSGDDRLHDAQRGAGSWKLATEGIATALERGFRVRVAATVDDASELEPLHRLLDALGIGRGERIVRAIVQRGAATSGASLARGELRPELTVTASGVFYHPVGADDADFFVATNPLPLAGAYEELARKLEEDESHGEKVRSIFPCG